MKRFLAIFVYLVSLSVIFLSAQSSKECKSTLSDYFKKSYENTVLYIPSQSYANCGKIFINHVDKYLSDTNSYVRLRAIDLVKRTGLESESEELRSECVFKLVMALKDADSRNSNHSLSGLRAFEPIDFTDEAVDSINSILISQKLIHNYEEVIKLAGFVGDNETQEVLVSKVKGYSTQQTARAWNVNLALARLGSEESLEFCINTFRQIPLSDNLIYNALGDLLYIRNKRAYDLIEEYINSDNKECISSNPDKEENVLCAYKVMVMAAPYIINYPLEVDSYGDVNIDNYEVSLNEVRTWFKSYKDYSLNLEKY